MADYKIIITQKAYTDIAECLLFVRQVSEEAAKNLYNEIINSINGLKSFPNAHPCIEGLNISGVNVRKIPIHKGRYLIIYKVDGEYITIYDIIDSRKDNSILKL